MRELALQVPNPADASVPDGGEDDGEVVRVVGDDAGAPAARPRRVRRGDGLRRHASTAAEASGSRFAYLMREAVLLELALVQWVDRARSSREGFTPVVPPVLVRERTMEEAGFFPTDRARCTRSTAASCSSSARARCRCRRCTAARSSTPTRCRARYAGISSCFRREAGTYGKDTRGIFRVHQFDKVEMFSLLRPRRRRADEHERILAIEESIVGGLGLPYRVVNIAAGDLGPAAAKKYDIEVWLPSEGAVPRAHVVLELPRLSRPAGSARACEGDDGNQLVHTLNGTACAVEPHARVPVRALPGRRRRLRRPRRAAPLHRLRPRRPAAATRR